jgi:hypothetical protein
MKLTPIQKSILALDARTKELVSPAFVFSNYNPTFGNNDEGVYYMYTSPDESSSSFVSLDISGEIKLNVWSKAIQSWQNIYSQPADPCTPAATCDPFTVGITHPFCNCMENFSRKSPHRIGSLRIGQEAASEVHL